MSEHTPGPWTVEPHDRLDKQIVIGPYHVAWADADDLSHEEAEANARLIAAAPDLLAALEGVVTQFGSYATADVLDEGRAAIAKATEVSPQ